MLTADIPQDKPPDPTSAHARIALIGDEAVGKSALVRVLLDLPFPTTHSATFEDAFHWSAPTPLTIIDMAGAAAYDRLRPFSYPGIPAFLICFAVDERRSFRDVEDRWVPELLYYVPGARIHLAALKTDLRDDAETVARMQGNAEEVISEAEGRDMAARIGAVGYDECSALRNEGVREVFEAVVMRETNLAGMDLAEHKGKQSQSDAVTADVASDHIDGAGPEAIRNSRADVPPSVKAKATSSLTKITRKPSITSPRGVVAAKTRPSPSLPASNPMARRPSTTSLSRSPSVSTLRKSDAVIPTPPTTPKLSHTPSVSRRPSVSKSAKVPTSPQLTNSTTFPTIPASARQNTSTTTQLASGSPTTAVVTRRPSTSRLGTTGSATGQSAAVTVSRRLSSSRLASDGSNPTGQRAPTTAAPGEHQRLAPLLVKTANLSHPALHKISTTMTSPTTSTIFIDTAPAGTEPVMMPLRRNGNSTAAAAPALRASPSTTRLATSAATAAKPTAGKPAAAVAKSLPETSLSTPTVRKRNSISSLWKRDASAAKPPQPASGNLQPQQQQSQPQRPVLRSASLRNTTAAAAAAGTKPVTRVAQQRPVPVSDTTSSNKGTEKEKKIPVWERLAGLAKKKMDKQLSAAAATGSAHRSWH
ncbi:hypothetical protein HDU86_002456 [Geranomyces michiganensis]|nr:hypothetical protein HDU86_002456 [Geranomyces michiganensis]